MLRLGGEFSSVEFLDGGLVRAGAAMRVPQLVVACADRGLTGLEPIVGVPGTVGGALAMNAGHCRIRPAMDDVQDRSALAAALEPAP